MSAMPTTTIESAAIQRRVALRYPGTGRFDRIISPFWSHPGQTVMTLRTS
jgi:hypothetical protein